MSYKDIHSKKNQDLISAKAKLAQAKTQEDKEKYEMRIAIIEKSLKKSKSVFNLTTKKIFLSYGIYAAFVIFFFIVGLIIVLLLL